MVKNKFGGNRHKKMASKDVKMVHTRKQDLLKKKVKYMPKYLKCMAVVMHY